MIAPIRVLVVDDSAFARKVLREVLGSTPLLEVVGTARDGLEALEKIAELRPDVVTLDLIMPNLDGIGVLRALPREDRPEVVVVSISDADSALGIEALTTGAFDVVHKPTALATSRLYDLAAELVGKVQAAGYRKRRMGTPSTEAPVAAKAVHRPLLPTARQTRLVVVGTSTGGPQALTRLLKALPGDLPVPVLLALHIPEGYTRALAERLNGSSALDVREGTELLELRPGMAVIAPGGKHLVVGGDGTRLFARIERVPAKRPTYVPSVDLLFESAAAAAGARVLGVVLTGMGDDGFAGARAITAAGGRVVTEAESSCVVYGMPRVVAEAGLSSGVATIDEMAALLVASL